MISRFFILFAIVSFFACNSRNHIEMTIPKDKAVAIFIDINLAEQALNKVDPSKKDSLKEVFMNQISRIHDVPYVDIEYNMAALQKNPEEHRRYLQIFQDTLEGLNERIRFMKRSNQNKKNKPKGK